MIIRFHDIYHRNFFVLLNNDFFVLTNKLKTLYHDAMNLYDPGLLCFLILCHFLILFVFQNMVPSITSPHNYIICIYITLKINNLIKLYGKIK